MARAVLRTGATIPVACRVLVVAVAAHVAACSAGARQAPRELPCSSDLIAATDAVRAEVPAFRGRIEASPFFRAAVEREGAVARCELTVERGALAVSYRFPGGGEVRGRFDPSIELSEISLTVSALSEGRALALLRDEERDAYGEKGCGIRWDEPTREASILGSKEPDRVYRGDVCNCQARMATTAAGLVKLLLRSAC